MPIAQLDNLELYYEVHGNGEPLILLHGAQGDSSTFSAIVPRLAEKFQVINFDQRGSGRSAKPDVPYTMEMLADDTVALMDVLDIKQAHIFGISLGGMIAQAFCLQHSERVLSVMMGCTLPGGWQRAVKKDPPAEAVTAFSMDEKISSLERATALANVAYSPGYADRHPNIIEKLRVAREQNPVDEIGLKHRLAMTGLFDAYDQLHKITCPCFIVTGKQDQLLDYRNSVVLAETITQAELLLLGKAGHVFWQEAAELFFAAYYAFVASLSLVIC